MRPLGPTVDAFVFQPNRISIAVAFSSWECSEVKASLRRLREVLILPAVRLLVGAFAVVPWSVSQKLGSFIGFLNWLTSRRERRRALDHLSLAFADLSSRHRKSLAKANFRHLGTAAGELLHLYGRPQADMSERLHIVGAKAVRELREAGKPVLIVSGHCGNWELIAEACRISGIPLVAVVRGLKSPALQKLSVAMRDRFGSQVIIRGSRGSSRLLLTTLRRGGSALAMFIDQDIQTEGVFVPFFGRPAFTPVGAARLAQRLGAAVVPTFIERLEDGSHSARFEEPLALPDDLQTATALMTSRIEAQIRQRPEQWIWMHRRWRRKPVDTAEYTAASSRSARSARGARSAHS